MRKFDLDRFGQVGAIVSSLMLMAIWLNLWVLKTNAQEFNIPISNFPQIEETPQLVQSVERNLFDSHQRRPIRLRNIISRFAPEDKQAVAYIFSEKMFAINAEGMVLASADSLPNLNLPIISGVELQDIQPGEHIQDVEMMHALSFIECAAKHEFISPLISQIKANSEDLIVYFNWGRIVPVKMGIGNWSDKLNRLDAYYRQVGNTELTKSAKYLDLRVEDRIIVKKNV